MSSTDLKETVTLRVFFALTLTLFFSSCIYQDMAKTCVFSSETSFQETIASDLRLLIAWPISADKGKPSLSFDDAERKPILTVELFEIESGSAGESAPKLSDCKRAETREYKLVVDQKDWAAYWSAARQSGQFSFGVALPGIKPVVRAKTIGVALAEESSGDLVWACGCLAK